MIFPIFAVLLFAVIDGGLLFGRYNDMNNAAKEAARLAAVGAPRADIVSRAEQQSQLSWSGVTSCSSTSTRDICVEWVPGPNGETPGQSGSSVRVNIRYRDQFLTPLPNWAGGGNWDIKVCAVQRLEQSIGSPAVVGQGTSC
ncbi:MAG: pilus assembly protein [Dehalococcoidia bacterium]|nr:pilus assembly protein [Dehalococcoidia bacterium]